MAGKLYMVATPIGNLEDITTRALETLKSVELILAEDTRVTRKLLQRFEINTPVKSYHAHSKHEKKLFILNELMQGKNIALVTDAGTPGISDPGNELLDFLYDNMTNRHAEFISASKSLPDVNDPDIHQDDAFQIIPVPGASSLTAALSVSGFNSNQFLFLGFWPKSSKKMHIDMVKEGRFAIVYFDSPHRLLKNLYKLQEIVSKDRRVLVARELTKLHETLYRGTFSEVIGLLEESEKVKGEVVVVIEGKSVL